MLPVSYLSKSRSDDDYLISKRMKKFYKSPELGENKKIPSNIKNKGSDIYDTTYDRDSYNVENLFDSNGEIENPDINVQYELKKKYNISNIYKLPEISRFDPQALTMCLRPGDICKFQRNSATAIKYDYFRICIQ